MPSQYCLLSSNILIRDKRKSYLALVKAILAQLLRTGLRNNLPVPDEVHQMPTPLPGGGLVHQPSQDFHHPGVLDDTISGSNGLL